MSEPYLHKLKKGVEETKKLCYVDVLDKAKYLEQESVDNSIWISPLREGMTAVRIR